MRRFRTVDPQGGPAHLALVDPWQQAGDFFLCRGNLRSRFAGNTIGLGQVAAQVPDPLAIGGRVGGNRHPGLWPATQAMGVKRFQVGTLGHHHVQRACLHGWLVEAQGMQQLFGAGAGAEHDALGADVALVDAQADQVGALAQWLDALTSQQAVACQFGQVGQQAGYIDDQFGQAIDLALEGAVLQRRWQLLTLHLVDPAAHGLAGEEAGEVAGQGAW